MAGIAVLIAAGIAAGGYYYLRERSAEARITMTAQEDEPEAAPATEPPAAPPSNPLLVAVPMAANATRPKKDKPAEDAGLPIRAGEVLEYSANVSNLTNVANLRVVVGVRRDYFGKSAWHLQAFAHTENPLRYVFALDDQFDSYSDAGSMASLQYEMHLDERGQKVNSVQRMTTTAKEPATPNVTEARVLPGTRDPLGMLEYLRHVDWTKTAEVRCPVYDGRKLYDVRAKVGSEGEAVTVPAGSFKTTKIELRVFEDGQEMKDAQFTIFIANNTARTPVLLEAVMPVATARVELTRSN